MSDLSPPNALTVLPYWSLAVIVRSCDEPATCVPEPVITNLFGAAALYVTVTVCGDPVFPSTATPPIVAVNEPLPTVVGTLNVAV